MCKSYLLHRVDKQWSTNERRTDNFHRKRNWAHRAFAAAALLSCNTHTLYCVPAHLPDKWRPRFVHNIRAAAVTRNVHTATDSCAETVIPSLSLSLFVVVNMTYRGIFTRNVILKLCLSQTSCSYTSTPFLRFDLLTKVSDHFGCFHFINCYF